MKNAGFDKPPVKTKKINVKLFSAVIFSIVALIVVGYVFIVHNILSDVLVTGEEYAELLMTTVENMDLPYEIKINLLETGNPEKLLSEINKSLDIGRKIPKNNFISREQAAVMTDIFLKYTGIEYKSDADTLTFVPDFISRTVYEEEILVNITDSTDMMKLSSYYTLKSILISDMTERAKKEIAVTYPMTTKTSVYVFDPTAGPKERLYVLELLRNYSTLTDISVAQMYINYGMVQRYIPVISFESVYLDELPDMSGADEDTRSAIEKIYIKTTLADESITEEEHEYIIKKYIEKYVELLFYRQLMDDLGSSTKREIKDIFNRYPEIERDTDDKYEEFDEESGIPVRLEWEKYEKIIETYSLDDALILNQYYQAVRIGPYSEIYDPDIPEDKEIIVYKMRDDLSDMENLRLDTYGFAALGRDSAALVEIFDICVYEDMKEISSWAKNSVEMAYKTNILSSAEDEKFMPDEKITWKQAQKIMTSIMSGVIVY